jgi:hypothetical protein
VQITAPSSIVAAAQRCASCSGISDSARDRSAAVMDGVGNATPSTTRANTRRTFVSSTGCRAPNANEATADAV